jgi:hypothetical protein
MTFTSAQLRASLLGLTFSSLLFSAGCASSGPTAPAPKYGNGSTAEVAPQVAPPNPTEMILFERSTPDSTPAAARAPESAPAMSLSPARASSGDHLTPRY